MGTWMYMPFGTSTPEPVRQSGSQPNTRSRQRRRRRNGGPPSQPSTRGDEEQTESEQMTYDPSVQPAELDDLQDDQHAREEQPPVRVHQPAHQREGVPHRENGDQQVLEMSGPMKSSNARFVCGSFRSSSTYMTAAEASLMLYTSLQGEAEQQLEFADIKKIYDKNGIDYTLEQLKFAFQQKTVYL